MKNAYRIESRAALEKLCGLWRIPVPDLSLPAFAVLGSSPPAVVQADAFQALYEPAGPDANPRTYRERRARPRSSRGRLPSGPPRGRMQQVHPESDHPKPEDRED